ncbi:hypothetical protein [Halobacillus sp. Nhm2S1]|uniref:hypothetical protein n=1 Tax=Halobacillus sp. Nhm2S1 TaxID=2866716 RepID=UPI001C738DF8|nr:hypothetical protein [Halobacillus sp. Nhm2S1]MBX0359245.1 hypothetical protein [Halobacillus sp. Nhm2S1]
MKLSTLLKWLTGGCEAFLAIPIAGGAFIFSNAWLPLLFMFVFHLITLVVSAKDKRSYVGSILGMITSAIGAIPFIGWVMHTVTAIVLLIDAGRATSLDNKS